MLLGDWWTRPDALQWIWISMAFSVIAVAVGVIVMPTVFQQFWGIPRLRIDYDSFSRNRRLYLRCTISNERVKNRLLRLMRVRTPPVEIIPQVRVRNAETRGDVSLVVPFLSGTKMDVYYPEGRLVGTATPIRFYVAEMNDDEDRAITSDGRDVFEAGLYIASVSIDAGEHVIQEGEQRFVVGKGSLYWLE